MRAVLAVVVAVAVAAVVVAAVAAVAVVTAEACVFRTHFSSSLAGQVWHRHFCTCRQR